MSEIKTRPIGERFDAGGVTLTVVETNTSFCDGCHWQNSGKACDLIGFVAVGGACSSEARNDRKNVIFKKVKL